MFKSILTKLFGTKHDRDVKAAAPLVDEINEYFEQFASLTDDQLKGKTAEFRARLEKGEIVNDIMTEAFAVIKEAARRHCGQTWSVVDQPVLWEMVHFDVQLIGGMALHNGKIAEMATGEGKTLVATLATYANALNSRGVHVVTVNDYLARRDREWMGRLYEFLGLTVGVIQNQMNPEQRRVAYQCDVTFGTANEFGFDYLRDNMASRSEDRVQRGHHYAIIDEVDSILIDEARTPLIISGQVESTANERYREMKIVIDTIVRKQTSLINEMVAKAETMLSASENTAGTKGNAKQAREDEFEAGTLLLAARRGAPKNKRLQKLLKEPGVAKLMSETESSYMQEKKLHVVDERLYFYIDEREHSIALTDLGIHQLAVSEQKLFEIPDLSTMLSEIEGNSSLSDEERKQQTDHAYKMHSERTEKVHAMNQLLRAFSLYEKDVEYVVQDEKVMIVDEFTGRILPGRRYSDGLHQAIEAKEGVRIEAESQTLATITLQNYFRMYEKLAGMTGTAETEAGELWEIYKLDVQVIPTNKQMVREDVEDRVYRSRREKYNAIVEEIQEKYAAGRPVLVGTTSVESSETIARMLKRSGVPHNVLNAKQHQREAEIVANAGQRQGVTIATNMAGRGTDIKLGAGVREVGGLHIVGTERHESRRIDRQLRGRAGRQGDPGSSVFFLSLEDDLMRLFGGERLALIMDKLGLEEGEVITHGMVTKSIERAQKKVELNNFEIRKRTLEYDDVMNVQRKWIYERRLAALEKPSIKDEVHELIDTAVGDIVDTHCPEKENNEYWNFAGLKEELASVFMLSLPLTPDEQEKITPADLKEKILAAAMHLYTLKESAYGDEIMRQLERFCVLSTIDRYWRDHLAEMDELRTGIHLRAYAQSSGKPIDIYKKEAFGMFEKMVTAVDKDIVGLVFRLQVSVQQQQQQQMERKPARMTTQHADATGAGLAAGPGDAVDAEEPLGVGGGSTATATAPPKARAKEESSPVQTVVRTSPKVGRNDPCPCGSGKKYKKCHGVNES